MRRLDWLDAVVLLSMITIMAVAMRVSVSRADRPVLAAGPSGLAQDAPGTGPPTAGTRRGDRCYNGRYWTDCPPAERPDPGPTTRVWKLTNTNTIYVIETTGVCLYWSITDKGNPALAAVPKTALPSGVGCE